MVQHLFLLSIDFALQIQSYLWFHLCLLPITCSFLFFSFCFLFIQRFCWTLIWIEWFGFARWPGWQAYSVVSVEVCFFLPLFLLLLIPLLPLSFPHLMPLLHYYYHVLSSRPWKPNRLIPHHLRYNFPPPFFEWLKSNGMSFHDAMVFEDCIISLPGVNPHNHYPPPNLFPLWTRRQWSPSSLPSTSWSMCKSEYEMIYSDYPKVYLNAFNIGLPRLISIKGYPGAPSLSRLSGAMNC